MFLAPTIKKPKENQCFSPWRPMGSPWGAHGAPQGIQDSKIELYEFPWPPRKGGVGIGGALEPSRPGGQDPQREPGSIYSNSRSTAIGRLLLVRVWPRETLSYVVELHVTVHRVHVKLRPRSSMREFGTQLSFKSSMWSSSGCLRRFGLSAACRRVIC